MLLRLIKKVDTIVLSEAVFGIDVRADVLQRVVRWQMAQRQSGNHQTKTVSDVSGTTRKPFKQKRYGPCPARFRHGLRSFVVGCFFWSSF